MGHQVWSSANYSPPSRSTIVLFDLEGSLGSEDDVAELGNLWSQRVFLNWPDLAQAGLESLANSAVRFAGMVGPPRLPLWSAPAVLDVPKTLSIGRPGPSPVGGALDQTVYISADVAYRKTAIALGLSVCPSPLLLPEKLLGFGSCFLRVTHPDCTTFEELEERFNSFDFAFIPVHVRFDPPCCIYGIAGSWTAGRIHAEGFNVDRLGSTGDPDVCDLYYFPATKLVGTPSLTTLPQGIRILTGTQEGLFVAMESGFEGVELISHGAPDRRRALLCPNFSLLARDWQERVNDRNAKLFQIRAAVVGSQPRLGPMETDELNRLDQTMFCSELRPICAWESRHVERSGNRDAIHAIKERFSTFGFNIVSGSKSSAQYLGVTKENVIASWPGVGGLMAETIVLGCHLDSVAETIHGPAPGADDDASGIAGMFCAATVLTALGAQFESRPRRTIQFAAFNVEEFERLGSAKWLSDEQRRVGVVAMVHLDMITYRSSSAVVNWQMHCGRPETNQHVRDGSLIIAEIAKLIRPDVVSGGLADPQPLAHGEQSDHLSYQEHWIPACALSEVLVGVSPPPAHWHSSSDTLGNIQPHLGYGALIARMAAGLTWVLATR